MVVMMMRVNMMRMMAMLMMVTMMGLMVAGQGWVSIAAKGTSQSHWTALSNTWLDPRQQSLLIRWSNLQTFNGGPEKTAVYHNDIVITTINIPHRLYPSAPRSLKKSDNHRDHCEHCYHYDGDDDDNFDNKD